jgi:hypothetical protein
LALVLALTAALGCPKPKPKESEAKSPGVLVAEDSEVAKVVGSPDGKWLGFLGQVERSHELGVPEGVLIGVLEVVPSDGSKSTHQLLGGVTNLDGAFAFSPDSKRIAGLKGYRFATHTGVLEVANLDGSDPVHLADDCSSFAFSPDSKHLAWVAAGGAFLGDASGVGAHKITDGAATFDFSRDAQKLLVRRTATAGGELLLIDLNAPPAAAPRQLAKAVGDYVFAPDGADVAYTTHSAEAHGGWTLMMVSTKAGEPRQVGDEVSRFVFSPDGKWLGYISGITPSKPFGDLFAAPTSGAPGVRVGERVEDFRFSPDSRAVALLEKYDGNAHSGTLALQRLPLDAPAEVLFRPVMHFEWSPNGGHLAYTSITLRPAFSIDLQLLAVNELKAGDKLPDGGVGWAVGSRRVQSGVYNYEFLSEETLLYRTECVMEGRACDLYEVPTDKPAMPARITGGVWRFQLSHDGQRMLVTYPRVDSETVSDLGVINLKGYGGPIGIDKKVEPGASFLDPEGKHVAYGVIDKKRRGVYVAEVPLPQPGQLPPQNLLDVPGMKATYGTGTTGTVH